MADLNINLPSLPKEAKGYIAKIFGPMSEVSELVSEKIRFYRWRSSLETMDKARIIAAERGLEVNEIPFRKLVPLLEKSSLEESESPLIDRWAELLALASHDSEKVSVSYIDVLSRIDLASVDFLDSLVRDQDIAFVLERMETETVLGLIGQINAFIAARVSWAESYMVEEGAKYPEPCDTTKEGFREFFSSIFDKIANTPDFVPKIDNFVSRVEREGVTWDSYCSNTQGMSSNIVDSLQSVGLAERHVFHYTADRFRMKLTIVMPTVLGFQFVMACRGLGTEHL